MRLTKRQAKRIATTRELLAQSAGRGARRLNSYGLFMWACWAFVVAFIAGFGAQRLTALFGCAGLSLAWWISDLRSRWWVALPVAVVGWIGFRLGEALVQ